VAATNERFSQLIAGSPRAVRHLADGGANPATDTQYPIRPRRHRSRSATSPPGSAPPFRLSASDLLVTVR